MLGQVGLEVVIREIDPSEYWGALIEGNYDMAAVYWISNLDPDQKLTFSVGADNNLSYFTRYNNPEVTAIVEQVRNELDSDKRRGLYYQIQSMVKDDAHWVDLYYSPFSHLTRTNVSGFHQSATGEIRLHDISLN